MNVASRPGRAIGNQGRSGNTRRFRTRLILIGIGIATCWVVLAGRLIQLQGFDRVALSQSAAEQRLLRHTIPARPGDILDRRGRLLVTSVREPSLYLVPRKIDDAAQFAARLATVLNRDQSDLEQEIRSHSERWFHWLERRMPEEVAEAVRNLDLPNGTWGIEREFRRRYPQGSQAVHLLGLRDIDNVGRGGIEQVYDRLIGGEDGELVALRDAHGRVIDIRHELGRKPVPGRSLVLTIDALIQLFTEEALDELEKDENPRGSAAIVLDPRTGEVLAIASRPVFDPENPSSISEGAWINRAVAAVMEPGSTVKPLFVAWALNRGVLQSDEIIDCENGSYRSGSRLLTDPVAHGRLSVTDVLVKSSNIGMAKIGERLGNDELFHAAAAFGFGRRTGSGLSGEVAGLLRPVSRWDHYSTGSVPMGQEFAVTPLQLAVAHAAIASDGVLKQPRFVKDVLDPVRLLPDDSAAGNLSTPVSSPVISSEIARWIRTEPMSGVVSRGTGRRAQIPGHELFGKTGTSQKYDPEAGRYSHERLVCSFVGGTPADEPEVLVLVMIDEPQGENPSGGRTAAPVAKRILERTLPYLGIPPSPVKSSN
ncbi:peptidoglycan D,D-transpeptidase FtsI family protein [Stratiformator vulcanicus]|uniref:Peptidoglycan D,D-transpeptidase FtsI n=1 Tax=Stratiformator vulcanicus TaxID=2527980 RepID=A0A517R2B5_9PLAN|nr:penicillin-binding protein 2 [Stratiformator vulcanicus]QDT38027.1 Peptidoglycan D,D-transpeptidase FtsI [Stratiformator vulcanicus]